MTASSNYELATPPPTTQSMTSSSGDSSSRTGSPRSPHYPHRRTRSRLQRDATPASSFFSTRSTANPARMSMSVAGLVLMLVACLATRAAAEPGLADAAAKDATKTEAPDHQLKRLVGSAVRQRNLDDQLSCQPDQCAHISCPADSRFRHELSGDHFHDPDYSEASAADASSSSQPSLSSRPPSAMYIDNNSHLHQHLHHNKQRHHQQRHINGAAGAAAGSGDGDDSADSADSGAFHASTDNETSFDDHHETPASQMRAARSVRQFKRRITIVPVDHHTLHKRSASATASSSASANLTACCVQRFCTCDTVCANSCAPTETPVLLAAATQLPGDCCDHIRCEPEPAATCYSSQLQQHFAAGQRWSVGACTQCECVLGKSQCQATLCKPLHCQHRIEMPGECCPRCDESRSEFCPGLANCHLACPRGHVRDAGHGDCKLCRCQRRWANGTTAATAATSDTTTSTSGRTTELTTTESTAAHLTPEATTTSYTTPTILSTDADDDDANFHQPPPPPASSPPAVGADPTDPTVLSIRGYFREHQLYVIVSATVFTVATVFGALVWRYCKISNKNSYNIVPNA